MNKLKLPPTDAQTSICVVLEAPAGVRVGSEVGRRPSSIEWQARLVTCGPPNEPEIYSTTTTDDSTRN